MATELSNHYKFMLMTKKIDFVNDTFKLALMATGFTYNKDTHAAWADVSASELAAGNGYTAGGATMTLTGGAVTEDDTNDRGQAAFDDVTWTASGGNIGPTPGAIMFDDTTTDDTIVGYIDFGSDKTAPDGQPLTVQNIFVRTT